MFCFGSFDPAWIRTNWTGPSLDLVLAVAVNVLVVLRLSSAQALSTRPAVSMSASPKDVKSLQHTLKTAKSVVVLAGSCRLQLFTVPSNTPYHQLVSSMLTLLTCLHRCWSVYGIRTIDISGSRFVHVKPLTAHVFLIVPAPGGLWRTFDAISLATPGAFKKTPQEGVNSVGVLQTQADTSGCQAEQYVTSDEYRRQK